MSEKTYPRRIYLPPAGRPRWLPSDPDAWDLLYLSWGQRWFGESPIPPAMHEGWVYAVVLEGSPRFVTPEGERPIATGHAIVAHPDCAYGWNDRAGSTCRLLTWLWRSTPALESLQAPAGGFRCLKLDRTTLRRLAVLHADCVREVATPDEVAVLALHCARLELDVALARVAKRSAAVDARYRLKLATEFLRNNPAERQPARHLCEYLQVSPAALNALFRAQTGETTKRFVLRWRMEFAREQLRTSGRSAKEVAFALGYRHANDFSRAFKRFFGITATACAAARPPWRK